MAKFTVDLKKWVETKAKANIDQVVRAAIIQISTRIIQRSPVDTGRFRNNWFSSFGSPSKQVTNRTGPKGAARLKDAQDFAKGAAGRKYFLTNNLPYALVIEFGGYGQGPKTTRDGYSLQAPYGVVRITVSEWNKIVNQEARNVRS